MVWSALTDDLEHCIECGRSPVQMHHIFFGISAHRKHAEEDGYIIPLCLTHHTGDWKRCIHGNRAMDLKWKRIAQAHFEQDHTVDEFRQRYGRNYL